MAGTIGIANEWLARRNSVKALLYWKPRPAGASLLFLFIFTFIFTLTACGGSAESNARPGTINRAPTTPNTSSATATAQIILGGQPCPAAVGAPSHWDSIVGTQNGVSMVEGVSCATLIGVPVLQALVTVRYEGTGSNLDVYVFNNIAGASPVQLFKLQGLNRGPVSIAISPMQVWYRIFSASSSGLEERTLLCR